MVKYEITFEALKDRFFPGFTSICKYTTYGFDEADAIANIAYNQYRYTLSRLGKGRETIIFFDKHPSPYFVIWVRRNGMWVNPEPIYSALFEERKRQTEIHIASFNTGEPGCSEKCLKELQKKYNYSKEKKKK